MRPPSSHSPLPLPPSGHTPLPFGVGVDVAGVCVYRAGGVGAAGAMTDRSGDLAMVFLCMPGRVSALKDAYQSRINASTG